MEAWKILRSTINGNLFLLSLAEQNSRIYPSHTYDVFRLTSPSKSGGVVVQLVTYGVLYSKGPISELCKS